ncbi:MAG: hypothetical protein WBB82_06480 [Limnothrix sp.]
MNKLSTPSLEQKDFGWSIQLYSGDRRLLFCLDPSHAWIFVIGLFLGYIIPFLGLGTNHQITEQSPPPESAQPAMLQVD